MRFKPIRPVIPSSASIYSLRLPSPFRILIKHSRKSISKKIERISGITLLILFALLFSESTYSDSCNKPGIFEKELQGLEEALRGELSDSLVIYAFGRHLIVPNRFSIVHKEGMDDLFVFLSNFPYSSKFTYKGCPYQNIVIRGGLRFGEISKCVLCNSGNQNFDNYESIEYEKSDLTFRSASLLISNTNVGFYSVDNGSMYLEVVDENREYWEKAFKVFQH